MDYSTVSSDTDALHGQSPWGSSSPRADRSFASPSETPASPTPIRGHSYTQSGDSSPETSFAANASEVSDSTTLIDPVAHQPSLYQQDTPQQAPTPAQETQTSTQGQQQRPPAARYHSTKQQRPVPQYKLQAKVTALERQGRKDPIIRFDVHVSCGTLHIFMLSD